MKLKVLVFCLFSFNCNIAEIKEESLDDITFEINLPVDANGNYILTLDRTKNQTIHTIVGSIQPPIQYKRFEWTSNLFFYFGPYVAATTNPRSYTDSKGIFRNSIGPTLEMLNDTLKLTVSWDPSTDIDDMYFYEPTESKSFFIILE
tara:strand:- start:783 stop:1223 length:441 start_codon:yes stop_codon:yes gene_type:complete